MRLIFEPHADTPDNDSGICSAWDDVAPTEDGEEQARELGRKYASMHIDRVFTPDLPRASRTAEIAFPGFDRRRLFLDWRLREADYGEFVHLPRPFIRAELPRRLSIPFPGGESYWDVMRRMKSFYEDVLRARPETVLIIGSRGTRCGLAYWVSGTALEVAITEDGVLDVLTDGRALVGQDPPVRR